MAIIAEKDEKTKTLFFFSIKLPREENHWTDDAIFQKTPPVCHILKTAPLLRETVSQNDLFRLLRFEGKQGAS